MKTTKRTSQIQHIKRVKFSEMSELVWTEKKSKQDMKACWYSKADMALFKGKTVRHSTKLLETWPSVANAYIEKSIDFNDDNQVRGTFHGLAQVVGIEHSLSNAVMAMIITTRRAVIHQVIEEQKRQRKADQHDAERIAQVSSSSSLFSRAWRHKIALMNRTD